MNVAYKSEWLVIIGFLGAIMTLYSAAFFLLVRRFIAPESIVPELGIGGKSVLTLAALGIVAVFYGIFIEPYQLEITHIRLPVSRMPHRDRPLRIVQFSDTHCDVQERLEEQVPDAIAREKPDLILFTGDAVNSPDAYSNFLRMIERVKKIAPTVCVKGDWDIDNGNCAPLERSGMLMIPGHQLIEADGTKLMILGVDPGVTVAYQLAVAPKEYPTILMYHSPDPDVLLDYRVDGIDLICCGHTHGGQVALPFYGALISQAKTHRQYARGLHRVRNTWVYTNRGIGMEGHFPRIRFCSKPEVTVFELVSADEAGDKPPIVSAASYTPQRSN